MLEINRTGFVVGGDDNLNGNNRRLDRVAKAKVKKGGVSERRKMEREGGDLLQVRDMKLDVKRLLHSISLLPSVNSLISSSVQFLSS